MHVRTLYCGVRQLARLAVLAGLASALGAAAAEEQTLESLPRYKPEQVVAGTIRLWGHGSFKSDFMGKLVKAWGEGFAGYHPDARLDNRMYGTASAIGALYTGNGDIAILGEEISPAAAAAFERARKYPPLGIEIATGSLDVAFFDYAHVVFVHKDNPISRLTLTQADAIFGAEHRRGPRNIRTWGELGLSGEWAGKRIQPYSWKDLDFSLFIQEAMLEGSHRWSNDLKEFAHIRRPDGSLYEHGQQILDALARDRFGIAISNLRYANPNVKAIALAPRDGGPYYEPTKENLVTQDYPLTRIIPAFIDRKPGQPIDPKVREFLRYILSREGQEEIVRNTGYLPLDARVVREQLDKLQ
jgi:phosphate transport system substrate-binding protein